MRLQERRRLANIYNDAFSNLDWLQTPSCYDGYEHGYQSYPCMFRPKNLDLHNIKEVNLARNTWMEALQHALTTSNSCCPYAFTIKRSMDVSRKDYTNSYIANECSISLPLFHGMTDDEQNYVIEFVRNSF